LAFWLRNFLELKSKRGDENRKRVEERKEKNEEKK
jgi:hypothetical protein